MAIRPSSKDRVLGHLANKVDFERLKSCQTDVVTFCGREYSQGADFSVNSTMNKYRESMDTFRDPRHSARELDSPANATEHRGYPHHVLQEGPRCFPSVLETCCADDMGSNGCQCCSPT